MSVFQSSSLPDDAVEVGRVLDAWGIKGWIKLLPHSSDAQALMQAGLWFAQPPQARFRPGFSAFQGTVMLKVDECRWHSDVVVAKIDGVDDRSGAEALKGASLYLPRSAFPQPATDEYYWVDLIGLDVVNREGLALGQVRDLMSTGPNSVLVLAYEQVAEDGSMRQAERMIPFVSAYVDAVDLPGRRITVDWQPDY
ncbi:MAG: ribosome maturation factor RimM [Betaproteobacteria bacterium]